MNWKEKRQKMDKALKKIVLPELRKQGFRGSYPHFRRRKIKKINLFSFQFSQWGGRFYINIANSPIDGITTASGHHIDPKKIKADQCLNWGRLNNFFDFEKDNYEETADKVLAYFGKAEKYWNDN